MKILIFGLPGSGKTTLASTLAYHFKVPHYNADTVREYHDDWDFELSIGKKQIKAQEDKIQDSRNKFLEYLADINAEADEVYNYLDKLSNEGW